MRTSEKYPNQDIASFVVSSLTGEIVVSINRMTTGDQYHVFEVKTELFEYVIRMTDADRKKKFISATYWQEKLLPIGVPLAKFIKSDLKCEFSPFPALLMARLPGSDLCNVYMSLSEIDKYNLANEIVEIHSLTEQLPIGSSYGILASYTQAPGDKSWYDFLVNRLHSFNKIILHKRIFNCDIEKVISVAKKLETELGAIYATPFLWDAADRNVIICNGRITGIVDVDEICFGDPLLVLGLTYTALEVQGYDTLYCDHWSQALNLDDQAKIRLNFYRLFYVVAFMCNHSTMSSNQKQLVFDTQRLEYMFQQSLDRL
jgi:fructosamine-3-kinase